MMVTPEDLSDMRDAMTEIRLGNARSLVLRRGEASLPAQLLRVGQKGGYTRDVAQQANRSTAPFCVLGAVDADIAIGDRFTIDGVLYVITSVRPDRRTGCMADAEVS